MDDLLSHRECDLLRDVHDDHVTALEEPIICFANVPTLRHHVKHLKQESWRVSGRDFIPGTYSLVFPYDRMSVCMQCTQEHCPQRVNEGGAFFSLLE